MLSMAELIEFCRDNNIPVGPGRGSVSGSRIAYNVGIVDLNPEELNTVFSRFANEQRVEIGDKHTCHPVWRHTDNKMVNQQKLGVQNKSVLTVKPKAIAMVIPCQGDLITRCNDYPFMGVHDW